MLALTHADEKANANSALKTIRKIHLTRPQRPARCCSVAERQQSPSLPRRRLGCCRCKTHVGPHARRRKSKREFSTKNHPQNSSYKAQRLHAAVLLQSGSNRLRSLVADLVARPAKLMLALTHADEKANANSALKTIRKIHLTRSSVCTLLFCCRAAAIAFAPSSPTWLPPCKTHVGPHARRRKSKREFSTKNHPQNSSYKVQRLHAAVLLQSGSNRLRSLVADLVAVLQNSCWPSRTPTKKQTRIQH